jgi:hypothetical protein
MQIPQMNNEMKTSLVGNSRSLETQTDSHFTHHHHHLPDDLKMEMEVEEMEAAVEAEAAEEDYPHQQDQACFLHTDELLTQSF